MIVVSKMLSFEVVCFCAIYDWNRTSINVLASSEDFFCHHLWPNMLGIQKAGYLICSRGALIPRGFGLILIILFSAKCNTDELTYLQVLVIFHLALYFKLSKFPILWANLIISPHLYIFLSYHLMQSRSATRIAEFNIHFQIFLHACGTVLNIAHVTKR